MRYTELIFDLYGTLLDIHTLKDGLVWEKTALYFGYYGAFYTPEELGSEYLRLWNEGEIKAGLDETHFPDIHVEDIFGQLFIQKGVTKNTKALAFSAAQLYRVSATDYIRLYPGVTETLKSLKEKGCRLWLLSNAQRIFTEYELRALGVLDSFEKVYISSDFGVRKPDVRFFRALIENEGLDPQKCLMIGNDRETDIAGATAAGLATVYMHTNLTPQSQASADTSLLPGKAPKDCRHFEYEGSDLAPLAEMLCSLE